MARYIDSVCRQCRREGEKIIPQRGQVLFRKNALWKENHTHREYMDRAAGRSPRNTGCSCARSKKTRRIYGVLEKQFSNYFKKLIVNRA